MTLPKEQRVVHRKDISQLLKSRIAVYDQLFHGKIGQNICGHARLVIVVSKKISKRAVIRNRIKRRISHVAERWIAQSELTGVDISLVVAKPPAVLLTARDLDSHIDQLLSQLAHKYSRSSHRLST
jgi:ribonuclease P protein component